jgi:CHAD domain-containing protein
MVGGDEEAVRRRAYEISLRNGARSPVENWRQAQRELLAGGAARLAELLAEQSRLLAEHEPGVRAGDDADLLRRHRVAARRARALLRAARDLVEEPWRRSLTERLRALGQATGPVRDLDVLLGHLRVERASLDGEEQRGAEVLRVHLEGERAARRRSLLAALDGNGYRVLLDELAGPPRFAGDVSDVALDAIAARELRKLVKAVRRLGPQPADEELHALRIAVKRARYAAELGVADRPRDGFLAAAKVLQTLLGEHQDAAVAEQRLREATVVDEATAAAFVAGRLAERQRGRRQRTTVRLPAAWRRLRRNAALD